MNEFLLGISIGAIIMLGVMLPILMKYDGFTIGCQKRRI